MICKHVYILHACSSLEGVTRFGNVDELLDEDVSVHYLTNKGLQSSPLGMARMSSPFTEGLSVVLLIPK